MYDTEVAELASKGFITTRVGENFYGRHWRITAAGMAVLNAEARGVPCECM